MLKYKRSAKKALAPMVLMLLWWVGFFFILFILNLTPLSKTLAYKGEVDIFIEKNDQGTEIYTLFSEENEYYKNMVILGASSAKNMPPELEKYVKNSIDNIAYWCALKVVCSYI